MPIVVIPRLLFSILSLFILATAAFLLRRWFDGYDAIDIYGNKHHFLGPEWQLYTGCALLAWSFLGRFAVLMLFPAGREEPREQRTEGRMVTAPDGSSLRMETCGSNSGPTLVLTHGWSLDLTAWWYAKRRLGQHFRLVMWDLPGLGKSKPPADGKYSIDRFAEALGAVVEASGSDRVVLVGHSIGGMTTETFWRSCREPLRSRIAGLVLVNTTHENPIETMWLAPLWRALRWPVIEPLMWLMIALSPLVWLSSWQSYLSGSSQLATRLTSFGRFATRGQVDFSTCLGCKGSPSVQARGNLAMFRWRATEQLPAIPIPVLVLAGTRDIITLPSASETIAKLIPRARLEPVEGCGHMGFLEKADVYNDRIAAFATEVFKTAA